MNILHIETSTEICSVALSSDGQCLTEEVDWHGPSHAQVLAGFVDSVVSFADSHALPLDAVAVSSGPGSYTGLRIGLSTAKGVCFGRNVPLIAVPTLKVLCTPLLLQEELPEDALLPKAAIFGHDANWGRILCALGYSGAEFDPLKVDLYFESKAGHIQIAKDGVGTDYSEEEATKILSEEAVTVIADIRMGEGW